MCRRAKATPCPWPPPGPRRGPGGYLVSRVYLPAGGDFSRVPLPAVTFTANGVTVAVPTCAASAASARPAGAPGLSRAVTRRAATGSAAKNSAAKNSAAKYSAATESVVFTRAAVSSGGFPNADSGYLLAVVTPPGNGDVVVIRGRAPTWSRGSHPSSWPARGVDLRYWSMCDYLAAAAIPLVVNLLPDGATDYGCRDDARTALDRHGDYTYVVGTEAQGPAVEAIRGATFVPFSTAQPATTHVLLLRNMLVSPDFAAAVQNVPPGSGAAGAGQGVGPYYPPAPVCPLATLAASGAGACLAGAS